MTCLFQMTDILTFLQTEVAKVRVGGKWGLLVLPGVVGDGLVNTLHRLKQLGGEIMSGRSPEISRQVAGVEKVGLCQLKWRRLCFQERPTVLRPLGRP